SFSKLGLARAGRIANLVRIDFSLVIDDAQRADDHLARREAGNDSHPDAPIPTKGSDSRLERSSRSSQPTLTLPLSVQVLDVLLQPILVCTVRGFGGLLQLGDGNIIGGALRVRARKVE